MASHTAHLSLHTAEHILTALLHKRFPSLTQFKTRLKSRKCVVTFVYEGDVTENDRIVLEKRLREVSQEALPITVGHMPRVEAEQCLPNLYQVPLDADPVRVVRVGEGASLVDERACIGKHVENTAEIRNPRLPTVRSEGNGKWRLNLVVAK